jgi:hypothetical protein
MLEFNLGYSILFLILAILIFNVITAWDALIDTLLSRAIGLEPGSAFSLAVMAIIYTLFTLGFFFMLNIDLNVSVGTNFSDEQPFKSKSAA